MEDRLEKICEECGQTIDHYWGYLSDFYPSSFPPRDRSNDQTLWGIEVRKKGKAEYHYFCSEEHASTWAEKQEK